MDRFVALLWDSAIESRTQQVEAWSQALRSRSDRWAVVLDLPGLRVHSYHHRGDGPVVTAWPERNGVIIGPLFRRGEERRGRIKQFSTADAERIAASDGDALIRDWWGNYVAIWRKPGADNAVVIRDPCGAVPCFMTAQQDVQILFAHAEDVAALPGIKFTIDWNYLHAYMVLNYFVTAHTGLREATELLPGQRHSWTPRQRGHLSWAWHAGQIAGRPKFARFQDAVEANAETALATFSAWGSEFTRPLVSLSGGLDSSILLNLLVRASDSHPIALHLVGEGYESFERELARLAAHHADVPLMEVKRDTASAALDRVLLAPRICRPKLQLLGVQIDETFVAAAERHGADGFMVGHGGDNLFLQRANARHVLVDYLRLRGPHLGSAQVSYRAATMRRQSLWAVTVDALQYLTGRKRWAPYAFLHETSLFAYAPLPPDAIQRVPLPYRDHPWLADARSLPPGKANHLLNIVALYNYYLDHSRGLNRDVVYPFFCQPITEIVLQTPTYLLCHDGIDRALERAAFRHVIPSAIADRKSKGGANLYLLDSMRHNLPFYRELLLSGQIARQPWIDRAKLEGMINEQGITHGGGARFLRLLASAEAWLHCWKIGATAPAVRRSM